MPNLLKSLPREILEKEDSKFIYNVLNPLLFDKIKETDTDTTVTHKVSALLNKDINLQGQFLPDYILPHNVNSREFHMYMTDGHENVKMDHIGKIELIDELDDIKKYIFFYFGVEGYGFLYDIIKHYFTVCNDYNTHAQLYLEYFNKYKDSFDIRKKKIYKSSYEHFKELSDKSLNIKIEFELVFNASLNHADISINQMVDNYARDIGHHLDIKTFDNDIIFNQSKLMAYLSNVSIEDHVTKHIYSGKNIVSSQSFEIDNVFELIAIFAMEFSSIKDKYTHYLDILSNIGIGYALDRSEHRMLKNEIHTDIKLTLESDNLTYTINETTNEMEIYIYFLKDFRIDESTFNLTVNDIAIPPSIHSLTGTINYGYTLYEYFDETTKYYKITIHDYMVYDLEGECINYDIDTIETTFDTVKAIHQSTHLSGELYLETTGFLDNFVLYRKNETSGFFEVMNVPYKVQVSIDEKEERYVRTLEFHGIDNSSHQELLDQTEIIIGCYDYDYFYEPKVYVDFFKKMNHDINIRYNTILPYVLIDDVMGEDFEIPYYSDIPINDYSTNVHKNVVMYDGKTYKKLYDDVNRMRVINPYNEPDYEYIAKISHDMYKDRNHINPVLITDMVTKIPFHNNLKYLNKMQYDDSRDIILFMLDGKQMVVPLNEGLQRGLNYEYINYNSDTKGIDYQGVSLCSEGGGFVFANNKVYLKNPLTMVYDEIEAVPSEQINLSEAARTIFFDMFEMSHCIIIDGFKYKIESLYIDTFTNALEQDSVMFVESKTGIPRYKTPDAMIIDLDFSKRVLDGDPLEGLITYDKEHHKLTYMYNSEVYDMPLSKLVAKFSRHRQVGMTAFSIFYAGNVLPENTNKTFFGRENIYNSMVMPDEIYNIGRSGDNVNDQQHHDLLATQLDLTASDASKYNIEEEPYIMFKSASASFKGLESYIKASLKSISTDIGIAPVYMVQRNRFISEWATVSSLLPKEYYAEAPLKELVSDLMETKIMNNSYDDLMDVFKNNENEKFSMDTNNLHSVLIQYIQRFLTDESMLENCVYYLIHEVWIKNNKKTIIDFIKEHADEETIRYISDMTFITNHEKEQLFYTFVNEVEKIEKQTIESYIPIANYADWTDYQENNHIQFERPYRYDVIDISDFITMPIEWDYPLYMIRPLNEDDVFVKRDYRFLDISMITNTQVTFDDDYNEYEEDIKSQINVNVDYVDATLDLLSEISITDVFDMLGVNLVVIKWIAERFIPSYLSTHVVDNVEDFRAVIKTELRSAEHPNMIVEYNRIKESTLLGDLGSNKDDIYDSIIAGELVFNKNIRLDITSPSELAILDKIKNPLEHYFDYLFFSERHDIVAKVLSLFTEDVIATSMINLSIAVNLKDSKGDETFEMYERMVNDIFDEFLPFHTVLDKIIFTFKILEGLGAESMSKELHTDLEDTYLIDIVLDFVEKIRIYTSDDTMIASTHMYIPTEGMTLCGGHDEIPYDYDRKVKTAGHDIPPHMGEYDDQYGVDDEWYVVNRDLWRTRVEDVVTPPYYAEFWWQCGNNMDFEKTTDAYLQDYFDLKIESLERDNRIESHFVDSLPIIDITQGITDDPDINVIEDYLIHIDSVYMINRYNMELVGQDEYGLDEASGPPDQTSLIDIREGYRDHILQAFYDKLSISILDSIWTDIVVVYDLSGVPGHDEFGIDEYYHQRSPDVLEREITTLTSDQLTVTDIDIHTVDMSDVSLVDEIMALTVLTDFKELILDTVITDECFISVNIMVNRNFDNQGHFLGLGHNEFPYDEYYHDSAGDQRLENIGTVLISENMDIVKVDFGFMRVLPTDPYQDLIDQQFYRTNQPGSEFQITRINDNVHTDIHTFGKDLIRIGVMDLYTLNIIDEDLRRLVYLGIESETIGGDSFMSGVSDTLSKRHIHHDFRENIIAVDRYAHILNDEDIPVISASNVAAQSERDALFTLEIGDTIVTGIHDKQEVDRSLTRFDRDYLRIIKVEEENFVEFKYMEYRLEVRFKDNLQNFMNFNDTATLGLTSKDRTIIHQYNTEDIALSLTDKIHYGNRREFDIDGMVVGVNETLLDAWTNRIYKDSMVISITESELNSGITLDYDFKDRPVQYHDDKGHMGYTEESVERTLETKFTDSLIFTLTDGYFDESLVSLYDGIMTHIGVHYGDYIDVVINETLHTYIDIVKKPWILPEFGTFGHNEYPHMYNGDSDEFDITTELRDTVRADAYTKVYDTDTLVEFYERIHIGYEHIESNDSISASMYDDLKVIEISSTHLEHIEVHAESLQYDLSYINEPVANIVVFDSVWYGYKMTDTVASISTADSVSYDYGREAEDINDYAPVTIGDWLLVEYAFIDDKPDIVLDDTMTSSDTFEVYNDYGLVALRDSLDLGGLIELDDDPININITDSLVTGEYSDTDITLKDSISIGLIEGLGYGHGKKFTEQLALFSNDSIHIGESYIIGEPQPIDIIIDDKFDVMIGPPILKDSLSIDTVERMKGGPVFRDRTNVSYNEMNRYGIDLEWFNDRYGVDDVSHSDDEMEYYNDSSDRSLTTQFKDDIKIIDTHLIFGESLTLLASDQIMTAIPSLLEMRTTDIVGVSTNEYVDVRLLWTNDRFGHDGSFIGYGVDGINTFMDIPHDGDQLEYINDAADRSVDALTYDDVKLIDVEFVFLERLVVTTSDKLITTALPSTKITAEREATIIGINESLDVRLMWLDDRYALEDQLHSEDPMEYYNGSSDRAFDVSIYEDIHIIVDVPHSESMNISIIDRLVTGSEATEIKVIMDGIVITSNDNLMYGIGVYDYVWDQKEWDKYGYELPYEDWKGLIPHDELPYDTLPHSQQGDELSQLTTGVTDTLIFGCDYTFKETLNVLPVDDIYFGIHRNMEKDSSGILTGDNIFIDAQALNEFNSQIMIAGQETLTSYIDISPPLGNTTSNFKDSLSVGLVDRSEMKPTFIDKAMAMVFGDTYEMGIEVDWLNGHYGVDMMPHSDVGMEFYGDSANRSMDIKPVDDIKIIDTHLIFNESLNILSADRLGTDGSNFGVSLWLSEGIIIQSNDTVYCDVESYDYVWDVKQWDAFGYNLPFEQWTLPYPFDLIERGTNSLVTTGFTDNLVLGFDFLFKDALSVQATDDEGFESWSYQSMFKEKTVVFARNQVSTDWTPVEDNTETIVDFRKESLQMEYAFDDKIKKIRYDVMGDEFGVTEVNTYDAETMQLIDTIFRYRIYEHIDATVTSDIYTTALFKYDDDLSLATNYKSTIGIYNVNEDGSLTISRTFIKDKVSELVNLFFSDGIDAGMYDKLHGTKAMRPDEYLD